MRAARRLPLRDTNESYLRTKLWNSRGTGYRYSRQQWKWTPRALGGPYKWPCIPTSNLPGGARNVSTHATRNEDHECSFAPRPLGRIPHPLTDRPIFDLDMLRPPTM